MTDNYKITLTPADTYFFGGEKTRRENDALIMDYFVVSNPYPQQTTLLGLLRYFLLLKNPTVFNGKSIINKTEAAKIIGDESFSYGDEPQDFGKIKKLLPLYFNNGTKDYFFAPRDIEFDMSDKFQLSKGGKNYNAKDHNNDIGQYLISNSGDRVKLSDVVKEQPAQAGNEKASKGQTRKEKENKFYKMTFCKLKTGWSFCMDAEIKDDAIKNGDSIFLPFGGEKSYFKLEVKKQMAAKQQLNDLFQRGVPYILCQSDCFVDANILDDATFAVNDFVSFRNLKSKVQETARYSSMTHKDDATQLTRSDRYNLLQRGSVLYFEDKKRRDEAAKKIIEGKDNCRNIGFNQILTN